MDDYTRYAAQIAYEMMNDRALTVKNVFDAVSEKSAIPVTNLMGREKSHEIDAMRHVAYFVFRERFGLTDQWIGRRIGKDRTTITKAVEQMQTYLQACGLVVEKHEYRTELVDMLMHDPSLTPFSLEEKVGEAMEIPQEQLWIESREAPRVSARNVCYYVWRNRFGLSYPGIAQRSGKDHTTVMHGVSVIEALVRQRKKGRKRL